MTLLFEAEERLAAESGVFLTLSCCPPAPWSPPAANVGAELHPLQTPSTRTPFFTCWRKALPLHRCFSSRAALRASLGCKIT